MGNTKIPLLAHTSPQGRELLDDHLLAVAGRARVFAQAFDAAGFGFASGFLHDLGKAKPAFQRKLLGEKNSEPHSAEGARFACKHYNLACPSPFSQPMGRIMAFVIAGHHSGLANGQAHGGGTTPLTERLETAKEIEPWFKLKNLPPLDRPPYPLQQAGTDAFGWAFFIRMLFSALVDADFLETERWFSEVENSPVERGWTGQLAGLKTSLDQRLNQFEKPQDDLAYLRAEVLDDCRAAAHCDQGLFSLTVPTGGGKTLSSLAFALDHAIKHNLDRVIYVIPFTSIVEQTAQVFRKALKADDAILEHHSGFDAEKPPWADDYEARDGAEKLRLATQNWDRPIIITTAVQFFESLFANRPGRCRKLHNIARSVVILDEAQTLPTKLLRPCLAALNELQRGYNTSIVLCTATQPALTKDAGLKAVEALTCPCEIISPDRNLYHRLKRVRTVQGGTMNDDALIKAMGSVESALCIVNNRRHARELFEGFEEANIGGARHLTTAMTAAHRGQVLEEIRKDLKDKKPVALVSTSLIEAGVDISFAAVWRAWAGLDQIAQAAGRCNRENELGDQGGLLTIFEPEDGEGRKPPPELKQFAKTARRVLQDHDDPLSQEAVAHYFRELLWLKSGDQHNKPPQLDDVKVGEDPSKINGIMKAFEESGPGLNFRFADIARAFQMIENTMVPVIIKEIEGLPGVGAPACLIGRLRGMDKTRGVARLLQPHLVQVPRQARAALVAEHAAEIIQPDRFGDQFVLLINNDIYSANSGLDWDDLTYRSTEGLMM